MRTATLYRKWNN